MLLALCVTAPGAATAAGLTIDEPFDSTSWGRFTQGGSARLTAVDGTDQPGSGWLRLNEAYGTVGYAYADDFEFPSNQAWTAEFNYAEWGSQYGFPGDGLAFYLYDAAKPFRIGQGGGCLGYCGAPNVGPGLSGGYVAIGLDEFGNFGYRSTDNTRPSGAFVIRGGESQDYPIVDVHRVDGGLITGLGWDTAIARAGSARIRISSTDGRHITVEMRRPEESWVTIFDNVAIPGDAPARLKLGFSSASGATDLHNEVRRFTFSTAAQLDYAVSVDDNAASAPRNQPNTWKVKVTNQGTGTPSAPVQVLLSSAQGLDAVSWSCQTDGGAACGSGTGFTATATSAVPGGKTYTFTVRGTPSATAQFAQLTATAKNTDASMTDVDSSNDTATDRTDLRATSPIASAGPNQTVSEGSLVTLDASGSRDPDGNPISYSWKLVSGTGPTPVLTTTTGARPQLQALDDGRWTFRVTVDNGLGDPASAEVTVTATNKVPVIASASLGGQQGGASLLSSTVSDEGVQDRQTAKVDWGDGTAVQELAVTPGAGWASVIGVHRYATAGTFQARLTVTDDDGGQATKQLSLSASRPASIWANSTTDPFLGFAFNWLGVGGKLTGTVHSNASVNIGGLGNTIEGATEYVKSYVRLGLGITVPNPSKVGVSSPPPGLAVNDFKPGGPVANELGAAYHDMTSSCRFGVWGILTPSSLTDGVYYAPCDVNITALHARGRVTIVSTGTIHFTGDDSDYTPYYKGVLALSSKTTGDAIEVVGTGDKLLGILDGRGADVELTGAGLRLSCGIIGNRVFITGADVRVDGGDCAPPTGTVADARVIPEVQTRLEASRDKATPGDTVRYSATLTNAQGNLYVNGLVGAQNTGSTNAQVTSSTYELQYQGADKAWRTIASSADATSPVAVSTFPMSSPGVTYGANGPSGSTITAGSLAAWGYQARVRLPADAAKILWDPTKALAVRSVLRLGLSGDSHVRELSPLGADITSVLRAASPDVTDARAYLAPPTGDVRVFSGADTPALARLSPGQSRTVTLDHRLAAVDARAPGETINAYIKRLRDADGAQLRGTLYTRASSAGVSLFGAQQRVATTRELPIVDVDLNGPSSLLTGAQAPFKIDLRNSGTSTASALTITDSATDGNVVVTGVPTTLAAAQNAQATATLTAPGAATSVRQTATASWKDANGNVYGTVQSSANTEIRLPATLRFVKTSTLAVDADGNSRISAGDTVEYSIVAENTGGTPLTGVTVNDPVPAKLQAITSSPTSTQGTASVVSTGSGSDTVTAPLGMLAGGAQATVKFRATIRPLAAGSAKPVAIENQAIATSDQLAPARSDDPATAASPDATVIQVVPSAPKLEFTLEAALQVDANADGSVSPGDTLRVQFVARNTGNQSATGVVLRAPVSQYETFVTGSLSTTGPAAALEDGVPTGRIDRLFAGDRYGIRYDVKLDGTLPDGVDRVLNAATAASNELPTTGPVPLTTLVSVPAHLNVVKTATLAEDRDGNGAISRGDVLAYKVVITNPGAATSSGTKLVDTLDSATSLVAGSIALTKGTSAVSGQTITATIGDLAGGASATLTYKALISSLADGKYELSSQATGSSTNLGSTKSDDPSGTGGQDPTTIPVVATPAAPPSLAASKRSWVSVDADGDGKASPGDTLSYEVTITNSGAGGASGVVASDKIDAVATLVVGSVQAPTAATVEQGNTAGDNAVRVRLGSIAAGASAAFTYQVTINPQPAGSTTVTSTGSVASNEVAPVKTGGSGATVPVSVPDLVPPTIKFVAPSDGSTITSQTPVTADIVAPVGQQITQWCLYAQRVGDEQRKTVKCGTGAPAGRDVGTFDPTVLPNGTYVLSLEADADGGGLGEAHISVNVSGALKPGRFAVSYTDMDLPIQTLPIRVTRSYDSFDKSQGDFGIGWRVGLDGFRVSVNRPLGEGGWTSQESDCMVLLGQRLCTSTDYRDLRSHTVTVTWPDGHAETFDFTPAAQTGGVVLGGTAGFTARKGATSKLRVAGDGQVTFLADGNLYETDQDTVFNPTQFELTAKDGTRYLLDTSTGLISSTDPFGNKLTVDAEGIHSSLGTEVRFTRDALGRITRIDGPSGEKRTYTYSTAGDLDSVTDSLNNTVRFEYDGDHNLTKTIDPMGRPTRRVEYDANGRISTMTDAMGNRVALDISTDGKQQTAGSPDGRLTLVTTTDSRGNPTRIDKIADGQTRTSRFEYDDQDRQTKATDALGNVTTKTYDAVGNLIAITDPLGNVARSEYDANGLLVKSTAADGKVTQLIRDSNGSVLKSIAPTGRTESFEYDDRGNQIAQTDAMGQTIRTAYDGSGNAVRMTDTSGATVSSAYDASGNLTSLSAPGVGGLQLQYDGERQLSAMVGADGRVMRYSYDALGQRTAVTDQLGRATVTTYNAGGQKTRIIDREGVVSTFSYDAQNHLVERVVGDQRTTYGYDGSGRMVGAANADATVQTTYDAADRALSFATTVAGSSTTDTVRYGYDAAGRRTSMSYGGVTDNYAYDAVGRLTELGSSQAGAFRFGYDEAGNRSTLDRPNGVRSTYTYDALGNVAAIVHAKSGTTLDESRYTYDAAGRRTLVRQNDGDHSYAFDDAGRLASADNPGDQPDEHYSYDESGNRVSAGEQYDDANRIQARTGYTYLSDKEGRITDRIASNGDATRFGWGADGRLRRITLPNGSVTTLKYDPMGRKIATTRSGQTRVQVYGLDPNAVAESTGSVATRFTFGFGYDAPLAMTSGTSSLYFQQDALNSVTSVTNASGSVAGRYSYGAYGQSLGHSGVASPYTFTGREYDSATDLYDYRARWYEPGTGRFLSEDPLPSVNRYAYALGNPTAVTDPSGAINLVEQAQDMAIQGLLMGGFSTISRLIRCKGHGSIGGYASNFASNFAGGFIFGKVGKLGGKLMKAIYDKIGAGFMEGVSIVTAGVVAIAAIAAAGQLIGDRGAEPDESSPGAWYVMGLIGALGSFASEKKELVLDVISAFAGAATATALDTHATEEECQ